MTKPLKRGEVEVSTEKIGVGAYDVQVTRRHLDGTYTTYRARTTGGRIPKAAAEKYGVSRTHLKDR